MRSSQETILKEFAERSLAARFVFIPNKLRNSDEPADLVWACNNCVILMYMTERKEYSDPVKRKRVRQKAIEHNLSQANGWLRGWRRGHYLSGSNAFFNFALSYKRAYRIMILSVVKCADAVAELHDEAAKRLNVSCCVTLPQSCVARLAHNGLTSLDLIHLLMQMRHTHGARPATEVYFNNLLSNYCQMSAFNAGVNLLWPGFNFDDRFHEATLPILGTRRSGGAKGLPRKIASTMDLLRDALNDITLAEILTIAVNLRVGMDTVRSLPQEPNSVRHSVGQLRDYDYGLCIAPSLEGTSMLAGISRGIAAKVLLDWEQTQESSNPRLGIIIIADCAAKGFHVKIYPKAGPSRTERLLGEMAIR